MLRAFFVSLSVIFIASCSGTDASGTGGAGGEGSATVAAANGVTSAENGATQGAGPSATNASGTGAVNATSVSTGSGGPGNPPFGGSSGGTGGPTPVSGATEQTANITYRLIVPSSYSAATPTPFLLVYSGTEGGEQMTQNLTSVGPVTGTDGFIRAILDGVQYNGNGMAGATVLDDVRSKYNIDNDKTYLLGESAGTSAAEQLGFQLRESYFAAYWANDVVVASTPGQNAQAIGFQPWGQVGPGGQLAIAQQIITGMQGANYRVPNPAPYAGTGADTHGDPQQFLAAVTWFAGKSRM